MPTSLMQASQVRRKFRSETQGSARGQGGRDASTVLSMICVVFVLVFAVAFPAFAQNTLTGLGTIASVGSSFDARAVTDDGAIVVGSGSSSGNFGAAEWTSLSGIQLIEINQEFGDDFNIYIGISADGSGYLRSYFLSGFIPTLSLDRPDNAFTVSAIYDGAVALAGVAADGTAFASSGFAGIDLGTVSIWDGVGTSFTLPTPLFDPGGMATPEADMIGARDATEMLDKVVGFFEPDSGPGAMGGPYPFLWTSAAGSTHFLPQEDVSNLAISPDGTYIVGQRETVSGPELFRWSTALGLESLGSLPIAIDPQAVTEDGALVVFDEGVWLEGSGFISVDSWASTYLGLDLSQWQTLGEIRDVSPDADVMIGYGTNLAGTSESWLAVPEPSGAWPIMLGACGILGSYSVRRRGARSLY